MKIENYTVKVLVASEGMKLTQANQIEDQYRTFSDKIYLAVNDSANNYKEVTEKYANDLLMRVRND